MQQPTEMHLNEEASGVAPRVLAINVGVSASLDIGAASAGLAVESAIRKKPVSTVDHPVDVKVEKLGLIGDEHADLTVHGGLDKAVYMYPAEHYEWWQSRRREAEAKGADTPLSFGALGENLTTRGMLEQALWIGDRIEIGEAVFRVEAPRNPCFKLNAVMGYRRAVKHMLQSGFAGVYLSVVEKGCIRAGSSIRIVPGQRQESIASVLDWRRGRAHREP